VPPSAAPGRRRSTPRLQSRCRPRSGSGPCSPRRSRSPEPSRRTADGGRPAAGWLVQRCMVIASGRPPAATLNSNAKGSTPIESITLKYGC
jgi:hypothetical protein